MPSCASSLRYRWIPFLILVLLGRHPLHAAPPQVVTLPFDQDPRWDGFRNRLLPEKLPVVRQDFGYRTTQHAGGERPGEMGGSIQRTTRRAYYAQAIPQKTLQDRLTATGKIAVTSADGGSGALIGWFNHESSQGWRTPDSLAMRIDGNGGKYWVFFEYGTSRRGTGGGGAFEGERYQTTPTPPFKADGAVHAWSLMYDPEGAGGLGLVTFCIDLRRYEMPLQAGHKLGHGALFNRFGVWNQQTAGSSLEMYLDDLKLDDQEISFDSDPAWISDGNLATFEERIMRPFHDFGYSETNFNGAGEGEIGGVVFRDENPMYYAAPVGPLSLDDELQASGKIVLESAGADSAVNFGWFNSRSKRNKTTPEYEEPQTDYLAVLVEGPSRVGHFFRPAYSTSKGSSSAPTLEGLPNERPVILPNREIHDWSLHYDPQKAAGKGLITMTFDGTAHYLELKENARAEGAAFDRFGVFNTQSGGHHVIFYLDDVSYSTR